MLSVYIPLIAFSILSISGPKWLPSLYSKVTSFPTDLRMSTASRVDSSTEARRLFFPSFYLSPREK